ncbi:Cof-type HAD-IIB family hydrolase [Amphibacillus sp. Q70]|uniref:Cof-type HAD-IIB family hydrolase n=1 Tax=Amphibacillus sp. Q70 TaxID=3453416 RepID=UPI003F844E12
MIKLIAIDLDGTLLSPIGVISPKNIEAIRKAQQAGIEVVVATGRSFESASHPLEKANLSCPIICINGAEQYSVDRQLLHVTAMNKDVINEIITVTENGQAHLELYTDKGIYAKEQDDFNKFLTEIVLANHPEITQKEVEQRVEQRFQGEKFIFTDDFSKIVHHPNIKILKALAFSFEPDQLNQIKQTFTNRTDVIVTSSGLNNIEFNHPEAQKGIALKTYTEKSGISLKNVMAIGDNYNDLSMLEIAGRSVAMENAVEEIKQKCDFVTTRNDQDGVAKAIAAILA